MYIIYSSLIIRVRLIVSFVNEKKCEIVRFEPETRPEIKNKTKTFEDNKIIIMEIKKNH